MERVMQKEDVITMLCNHQPYTPAAATDVLSMFKRKGWIPPSEQQVYQDKWAYYKSLVSKTEQ
jgi:hypothetical protein